MESYGGVAGGAISMWNMTKDGMQKLEVISLLTASPAHHLVSLEQDLAFCANMAATAGLLSTCTRESLAVWLIMKHLMLDVVTPATSTRL